MSFSSLRPNSWTYDLTLILNSLTMNPSILKRNGAHTFHFSRWMEPGPTSQLIRVRPDLHLGCLPSPNRPVLEPRPLTVWLSPPHYQRDVPAGPLSCPQPSSMGSPASSSFTIEDLQQPRSVDEGGRGAADWTSSGALPLAEANTLDRKAASLGGVHSDLSTRVFAQTGGFA